MPPGLALAGPILEPLNVHRSGEGAMPDDLTEESVSDENDETPVPESLEIDEPPIDVSADPDEGFSLPGRGA